jgi:hypothetical protein
MWMLALFLNAEPSHEILDGRFACHGLQTT